MKAVFPSEECHGDDTLHDWLLWELQYSHLVPVLLKGSFQPVLCSPSLHFHEDVCSIACLLVTCSQSDHSQQKSLIFCLKDSFFNPTHPDCKHACNHLKVVTLLSAATQQSMCRTSTFTPTAEQASPLTDVSL